MDQATKLRQMVQSQAPVHHEARVITVTSGKGGVGKSSISVNLAISLSRMGKRVVILDADFGLANVEVMLGIRPQYNLADLMFRGKTLSDIITKGPENIGFISGGSGIQELTNMSATQITYLTQKLCELDNMADVIIIDTGAGISASVLEFVASSSEVLLVATPEPTSITDAYALLKTLSKKRGSEYSNDLKIKMISNRVKDEHEGEELHRKLNMVVTRFLKFEMDFLGAVPLDMNVTKAVMQQKPFVLAYPECHAAKAVDRMVLKLLNVETSQESGIARLFSIIIRKSFKKKRQETIS